MSPASRLRTRAIRPAIAAAMYLILRMMTPFSQRYSSRLGER